MSERIVRSRRARRRGFTLLELMVGVFIALFLTAAAVVFASHETKLLGYSTEQVDAQQQARAAIDLLTNDLQMAGAGMQYSAGNSVFNGLQIGQFTSPGGFNFGSANLTLRAGDLGRGAEQGATYVLQTRDIGILTADGQYGTIAQHTLATNSGELCDPQGYFNSATNFIPATQRVVLRTEDGITWQTIRITPAAGPTTACTWGQCANGGGGYNACRTFTLTADPVADRIVSDASALTVSYTGGEVLSGFKQIVWFVQNSGTAGAPGGSANLKRMVFDAAAAPCTDRYMCGTEQAYNVETLQYQVWRYNSTVNNWIAVPNPVGTAVTIAATQFGTVPDRLRVDVEMVVRNRVNDGKSHEGIQLRLANPAACVPNTACPPTAASADNIPRRAYRWTVQVRNSGRI